MQEQPGKFFYFSPPWEKWEFRPCGCLSNPRTSSLLCIGVTETELVNSGESVRLFVLSLLVTRRLYSRAETRLSLVRS